MFWTNKFENYQSEIWLSEIQNLKSWKLNFNETRPQKSFKSGTLGVLGEEHWEMQENGIFIEVC